MLEEEKQRAIEAAMKEKEAEFERQQEALRQKEELLRKQKEQLEIEEKKRAEEMKRLEEARRVEEERIRLAEEEARRQIEAAEAIQVIFMNFFRKIFMKRLYEEIFIFFFREKKKDAWLKSNVNGSKKKKLKEKFR